MPKVTAVCAACGRSGKGEVTQALLKTLPDAIEVAMARTIKSMLEVFLGDCGVSKKDAHEYLYGHKREVPIPELDGLTVRTLAETLGGRFRDLDKDIWVKPAKRYISKLPNANVIISDARYPNEMDLADDIVWVDRPDVAPTGQESEGHVTAFDADYHIYNDGSLQDLHKQVENIARCIDGQS